MWSAPESGRVLPSSGRPITLAKAGREGKQKPAAAHISLQGTRSTVTGDVARQDTEDTP